MPRVSVIIPTYNMAVYLPEAIESVLVQTYRDFEVIVVDDGSTDNTKEVLGPYFDRITFIETVNGGPSRARNHAIRQSSGEYVAFLDADDIWYPDKLERQLNIFSEKPHYALVHSDALMVSTDGSQEEIRWFSHYPRVKAGQVFGELLKECFIILSSVIAKRDCLERAGLFDENLRCWEGYDLWLRIAFENQIGLVDSPLYLRQIHENNLFFSVPLNQITGLITIMEKWDNKGPLLSATDRNTINQRLRVLYHRLGAFFLTQGDPDKARPVLKKSLARGFSVKRAAYLLVSMLPRFALPHLRKVKHRFSRKASRTRGS